MSQGPIPAQILGKNPSGQVVAANVDASGNIIVASASGGDAVTIADGADVAQGAKADAAWTTGAGSVIALLKAAATALNKLIFGAAGSLLVANGINTATNLTAAAVVKASAGRACKLIILDAGTTSGAFVLNDCATTGAAATANEVFRLAYNATANVAGAIFNLDLSVTTGLVLSAVPGGGTPRVAIVWN